MKRVHRLWCWVFGHDPRLIWGLDWHVAGRVYDVSHFGPGVAVCFRCGDEVTG